MSVAAILAPLFMQALLVLALAVLMGLRRFRAIKQAEVKTSALVGDDNAWPKPARLAANAFHNQFQFPLLFYVLSILVLVTKQADLVYVILAWCFVASRYAHAIIHVTTNRMPYRFYVFMVGVAVLTIMWFRFAIQVLIGA